MVPLIMKKISDTDKRWIVKTAFDAVEAVIKDWKGHPHCYYNERDIHFDISFRIQTALRRKKLDLMWAKYQYEWIPEHCRKTGQYYSRMTCEPPFYCPPNSEKCVLYKPDIVIWDDDRCPEKPELDDRGHNPKILWICEIKHRPGWKKKRNIGSDKDVLKLRTILGHDKKAFGCVLDLRYRLLDKEKFEEGVCSDMNSRLRIYKAKFC
jgi:hypothetical protein